MTCSIVALGSGIALRAALGLSLVAVLGAGCAADKEAVDAKLAADAEPSEAGAVEVGGDGHTLPVDAADDAAGCSEVSYPAAGFWGKDVLALEATSFISENSLFPRYENVADLAPGATVTVKITMLPDTLAAFQASFAPGTSYPSSSAPVWYIGDGEGWLISFFDNAKGEQVFQSASGLRRPERQLSFGATGQARVDYFECGSATPTRTKTISSGARSGRG